jgi:hypothetical protein
LAVDVLVVSANADVTTHSRLRFHVELESTLKIIPIFPTDFPFEGPADFQALKNFRFSAISESYGLTADSKLGLRIARNSR